MGAQSREMSVFVSYGHADENWVREGERRELIPWLRRQLRPHLVAIWADLKLVDGPSGKYRQEIENEIRKSQIALLLMSEDFASSDFVRDVELPLIQARMEQGEMAIIPIQVSYLTDQGKALIPWIYDVQVLPSDTRYLVDCAESEAEWARARFQILQKIHNTLRRIREATDEVNMQTGIADESAPADSSSSQQRISELGSHEPIRPAHKPSGETSTEASVRRASAPGSTTVAKRPVTGSMGSEPLGTATSDAASWLEEKARIQAPPDPEAAEAVQSALAEANAQIRNPGSHGLPRVEEGNTGAVWRSLYDSLKGREVPELRRIISVHRERDTLIVHIKAILFLRMSLRMDEGRLHAENAFAQLLLYDVYEPWDYIIKATVDNALKEAPVPPEKKNEMLLNLLRTDKIRRSTDFLEKHMLPVFVSESTFERTRILLVELLSTRPEIHAGSLTGALEVVTVPGKRGKTAAAVLERLERSPSQVDGASLAIFKAWNITEAIPRLRRLCPAVSSTSVLNLSQLLADFKDKDSARALHDVVERYRYGDEAFRLDSALSHLIAVAGPDVDDYVSEVVKMAAPKAQRVLLAGSLKKSASNSLQQVVERLSRDSLDPMTQEVAGKWLKENNIPT